MEHLKKPLSIGRIIETHFNWEQYMEYINPEKMKLVVNITSDEIFNQNLQFFCTLAGKHFKMTEGIEKILPGLIYYFNGNTEKAKYHGLDTHKGIALVGEYGVGKTILFSILREYVYRIQDKNPNLFIMTSTDKIVKQIQETGETQYDVKQHICINEFGRQYDMKHFGNDMNEIIDSLLMRRYEIFQQYGKVTHITSNYGTRELEKHFHPRLVDRFKEMFNMVPFEGKSFRK